VVQNINTLYKKVRKDTKMILGMVDIIEQLKNQPMRVQDLKVTGGQLDSLLGDY